MRTADLCSYEQAVSEIADTAPRRDFHRLWQAVSRGIFTGWVFPEQIVHIILRES